MTYLYNAEYLKKVRKTKNLHLFVFIAILFVYLVLNVILLIIYANQPYGSNLITYFKIATYVSSAVFIFTAGIYYFLVFSPKNKTYLTVLNVLTGKKESGDVTGLRLHEEINDIKGVYFKSFDVLEWSDIRNDYVEITINYDASYNLSVKENQMLKIIVCGNILLAYEVIWLWKEVK